MGMHTKFHLQAELKEDVPEEVIKHLQWMLGQAYRPQPFIDHPLFQDTRASWMLNCSSAYFPAVDHSTLYVRYDRWHLNVDCDFKNYSDEVAKFTDWIMPYVEAPIGEFLGYSMYEEHDEFQPPELIFKTESGA
jgi:hypothetical protein